MIKVFCDECEEEIKRPFYLYELKFNAHFCNNDCLVEYRKRTGHYKRMSLAGKAGRSRVMPQSNREKPRRRKQMAMWL